MGTVVAFEHEKGERVLVNPDHVVMVFGHGDVCTLMLPNTETIPVRGTLDEVQRLLQGSKHGSVDEPRGRSVRN
jgi:hypothetical protein